MKPARKEEDATERGGGRSLVAGFLSSHSGSESEVAGADPTVGCAVSADGYCFFLYILLIAKFSTFLCVCILENLADLIHYSFNILYCFLFILSISISVEHDQSTNLNSLLNIKKEKIMMALIM